MEPQPTPQPPKQSYELRPEAQLLVDIISKFFGFMILGFKAIFGVFGKKEDKKVL